MTRRANCSRNSPSPRHRTYSGRKRKLTDDVNLFLPCAIRACEAGVARTHLISRHTDGAVLQELFSDEGIGTMVVESTLNTLRDASIEDIGGILELLRPLEESGILLGAAVNCWNRRSTASWCWNTTTASSAAPRCIRSPTKPPPNWPPSLWNRKAATAATARPSSTT